MIICSKNFKDESPMYEVSYQWRGMNAILFKSFVLLLAGLLLKILIITQICIHNFWLSHFIICIVGKKKKIVGQE